jgi:hypothetical protein
MLMGKGVWDAGKSEGRFVMKWIGIKCDSMTVVLIRNAMNCTTLVG